MDIRIIKSPSKGTLDILMRRKGSSSTVVPDSVDAIGLVQGKLIDMVVAADIAQKSVGVTVEDIKGSCPQNMILLAIFGDTAAVEQALSDIKIKLEEGSNKC
ncbi:BMC domain-containing protein [[Eubacterium] yurii]|jgi:bacterial microcompartments protein|nr:MAG: BMC domain-containing protein [Lachnospiraceae bacterium]SKC66011.1 BMC domain-containing protein [[Eubacterium] yurii]